MNRKLRLFILMGILIISFKSIYADATAPAVISTVLRGYENDTSQFTFYNETSAYDIEKFNITAEFNDAGGDIITEIELFWRNTNGTNNQPDRCSYGSGSSTGTTGNINDETCYEWLSAIEDINTGTMYEGMTVGDGVDFTNITVNDTSREVEFMIDEIYKNTIKDYPFYGNTSYFDNGTDYRIRGNNYRKWLIDNNERLSSDASFYQFDLRMQIVGTPNFPLEIYLCNSSYSNGEPADTSNCAILNTLTSADVKPTDSTKYRTTFGNDTINDLGGNITDGCVVLKQEGTPPSKYYAVQYFDKRAGDTLNHSYYSTDAGDTWAQIEDKSDAIGLHWFYEGTTCFEYFFETTDNNTNVANSTVNSQCWSEIAGDIDDKPSEPILIAPLEFYNWSGTQTLTWIKSEDPEGHDHFYEITLQNEDGTFNSTIADESTGITRSTTTYSWNTALVSDGIYNMTIKAVQNESIIGLNSTEFVMAQGFTVDNNISVQLDKPLPYENYSVSTITFNATPTETNQLDNCSLWGNWTGSFALNYTLNESVEGVTNNITSLILEDGRYLWNVRCSDHTGNSAFNETNQTFTVDTTYPLIYIDSPANQTYSNETIDLNYSIVESNLANARYTNDSGSSNYTITANQSQLVWDEGSNTILLYANDSASNENMTSVTFNVDTTISRDTSGSAGSKQFVKYDCLRDSDCENEKVCWENKCVELFDIVILDLDPIIKGGFEVNYWIGGKGWVSDDVVVKYYLEGEGFIAILKIEKLDVGYFEEINRVQRLEVPKHVREGEYKFYLELNYKNHKIESEERNVVLERPVEKRVMKEGIKNKSGVSVLALLLGLFLILAMVFSVGFGDLRKIAKFTKFTRFTKITKVAKLTRLTKNWQEKLKNIKRESSKLEEEFLGRARYVSHNIGKEVYSLRGLRVGKVKETLLRGKSVHGLLIELDKLKRKKIDNKDVFVNYKDVMAVDNIVLVDKGISDALDSIINKK